MRNVEMTPVQKLVFFSERRKRGDVTKAAEMLGVTVTCVSRQINFNDTLNEKTANVLFEITKRRKTNQEKLQNALKRIQVLNFELDGNS